MIPDMGTASTTSKTADKIRFKRRIRGTLIVFIVSRKFIDLLCDDPYWAPAFSEISAQNATFSSTLQ